MKIKYKSQNISWKALLLSGVVSLCTQTLFAQIKGEVFNSKGQGVPDVQISANGGVIAKTDSLGLFTIKESGISAINLTASGYFGQEVKLNGKESVRITLKEDYLNQVVNIAYGQSNKREFTGAYSSVSGDELAVTPVPTLSNTLYGRLNGLTVMQGSGEPGYDSPSMLIRGRSTYRNAGFRTYIDGFEANIEQISPYEIEDVTILKDAASLALYGLHGANGAMLVTTKKGRIGKPQIKLDLLNGWQQPVGLPEFLGSYDYARLYNEALANDGLNPRYTQTDLDAYKNGTDKYLYPDVNWYDEVLKESTPISTYNLSALGGNKTARYFVFLGYMRNQGLYANTDKEQTLNSNADFKRYNFRTNIDIDVTKHFKAEVGLGGQLEDRIFPNFNGPTLWNNMAIIPPNAYPVRNPNGSWGGNGVYSDNPVASVLARGYASSHDRTVQASVKLTEDLGFITEGLKFSQSIAFNNWFTGSYNKTKDYARFEISKGLTDDGRDTILYHQRLKETDFSINDSYTNQWNRANLQAALNYNRQFGDNSFAAMLMYHQDKYVVSGNEVPYAYQSVNGRVNYGFKSKYYAELGFSYSGSENFPKGNRFGFFPAISAGWIASEESFLKNSKTINFLKIRGSFGVLGNDNIGSSRFAYNQYYSYSGGTYLGVNNDWWGGISEGSLGNPDITWEKSTKLNLGFDSRLINALDATFDVFYEKRTGILADRGSAIPSIIGVGLPTENVGEVTNRGFELNLTYGKKVGEVAYSITGMAAYAKNKIDYMSEVYRPDAYSYRTGHNIGKPFGLEAIGLFKDAADVAASPVQTFSPVQPGDIKYKDQNNDGFIDENDEIALGSNWEPEFTYSFIPTVKYKGFDAQAVFQGVANRSVYLSGPSFWAFQDNAKIGPNALNRWTPATAETADYPRLTTLPNDNNYRSSSFWIKNGAFLRLRNITLGYTFPEALTSKVNISKARLYVTGVNLVTWDKLDTMDPETMSGYPALKSYNIGLSVNF